MIKWQIDICNNFRMAHVVRDLIKHQQSQRDQEYLSKSQSI